MRLPLALNRASRPAPRPAPPLPAACLCYVKAVGTPLHHFHLRPLGLQAALPTALAQGLALEAQQPVAAAARWAREQFEGLLADTQEQMRDLQRLAQGLDDLKHVREQIEAELEETQRDARASQHRAQQAAEGLQQLQRRHAEQRRLLEVLDRRVEEEPRRGSPRMLHLLEVLAETRQSLQACAQEMACIPQAQEAVEQRRQALLQEGQRLHQVLQGISGEHQAMQAEYERMAQQIRATQQHAQQEQQDLQQQLQPFDLQDASGGGDSGWQLAYLPLDPLLHRGGLALEAEHGRLAPLAVAGPHATQEEWHEALNAR